MIRLVHLLRRKQGMSLEEFHAHWRNDYGPLVAYHQSRLGIIRSVQSHRLADPLSERDRQAAVDARGGQMEAPYDGVNETWWESEDALSAAAGTAEGKQALRDILTSEDEFIDLPNSSMWFAYEYPHASRVPGLVVAHPLSLVRKFHLTLRHPAGLTLEDAQKYWLTQHGPLARRLNAAQPRLRYQQVHRFATPLDKIMADERGGSVEPYTGLAESWNEILPPMTSAELQEVLRRAVEDEKKFIDFPRSTLWMSKEHVLVDRW